MFESPGGNVATAIFRSVVASWSILQGSPACTVFKPRASSRHNVLRHARQQFHPNFIAEGRSQVTSTISRLQLFETCLLYAVRSTGRRRHPSSTPDDAADVVCNISPVKKQGPSIVLSAKNSSLVFNNLVSQGAREAKLLKTSDHFVADRTTESSKSPETG